MSFMPGSSVSSRRRAASVRPIASAATLARMLAVMLPPTSMQAALNGTPLASEGIAASPADRKWRGSTPPMRAATSGFVTTSSIFSDGIPSRFIATAVAMNLNVTDLLGPGMQEHVAVLRVTARAPGLEEVLVHDPHLALR